MGWEWASYSAAMRFVLPPPSAVVEALWQHADRYLLHSAVTLREMLGGLALAAAVAFPLAWLLQVWEAARRFVQPLVVASQCLPMLTLAPLMVIWFGWTYTAVIVPTALMLFFPLTINVYQGLRSVPDALIQQLQLWGATPWQQLWRCQLPWALPQLSAGLRIAAGLAGTGAVVAEWAGAQEGLGLLMLESRRSADVVTVFGAIVCLVILTLSCYGVMALLEKLAERRRPLKVLWRCSSARFQLLGAVALSLALLACASVSGTVTSVGQVRLALDWLPNPNHIPLFVGVEKGIFRQHGIDLQILKIQEPGDAVAYVTSRQVDIAMTYMPSLVMGAQSRGADLRVVGYLIKEPLNALIARDGIAWEDCVLGCVTDGIQTVLLETLLRENKIRPKKTIHVSFDAVTALLTGQVDALFGAYWNIEAAQLRHWGIETEIITLEQLGVPHHFELVAVADRGSPWAEDLAVSQWRDALQESIDWSREHSEEAFALYASANPDKHATTLTWEREAWRNTVSVLAQNQDDEPEVWEAYAQWLALFAATPAKK